MATYRYLRESQNVGKDWTAGPQIFVLQMDLLFWQARQLCSYVTSYQI